MEQQQSDKCDLLQDNKTLLDEIALRSEKLNGVHVVDIVLRTICVSSLLILSSCTYSITQVHTEGTATDVVDETNSNTPNIAPNLTIPANLV